MADGTKHQPWKCYDNGQCPTCEYRPGCVELADRNGGKGYTPTQCYVSDCRVCVHAPCDAWRVREWPSLQRRRA